MESELELIIEHICWMESFGISSSNELYKFTVFSGQSNVLITTQCLYPHNVKFEPYYP